MVLVFYPEEEQGSHNRDKNSYDDQRGKTGRTTRAAVVSVVCAELWIVHFVFAQGLLEQLSAMSRAEEAPTMSASSSASLGIAARDALPMQNHLSFVDMLTVECFGAAATSPSSSLSSGGDRLRCLVAGHEDALCSSVYVASEGMDVERPDKRQCKRVTSSSSRVFDFLEDVLLPALMSGRATCVCRSHFDVILYEQGDFFSPHRDFVRVKSDVVKQYFAVYSVAGQSCAGGSTVVNGVEEYWEPTEPRGALACPADALHESTKVTSRYKLVVKFDFLLFADCSYNDGGAAAMEDEEEELVTMEFSGGKMRGVPKATLKRVPFFQAALRFDEGCRPCAASSSGPLQMTGFQCQDLDQLLDYLKGGGRCPADPGALLQLMDALSMSEAAAVASSSWVRFLAGAPVFVENPEILEHIWDESQLGTAAVVPFVAVCAQRQGQQPHAPTELVFAAVTSVPFCRTATRLLADGMHVDPKWLFSGPSGRPKEAGLRAVKRLAQRVVLAATDSGSESEEVVGTIESPAPLSEICERLSDGLRARGPLLVEMLRNKFANSETAVAVREEQEYCNDGHFETFFDYETITVSYQLGLFRMW